MVLGIILHVISILGKLNLNYKYLYSYNLMRIRRFLIQTIMIFVFQFMTIINMTFSDPVLPMYPPIGISFVMFYLFGNNAVLGLLLSGFCAYLVKNLAIEAIVLYLMADIIGGYVGSVLCGNIFSSDIKPFANLQEVFKFLKTNSLITCLISGLLRISVVVLLNHNIVIYDCINVWLADLNAILILASFLLSWSYVSFSREKLSEQAITIVPIIMLIMFIVFSMLFMQKIELGYLIIVAMVVSIYFAHVYGYLVATALLFIISAIFLSYFIAVGQQYVDCFGLKLYTLVPIVLFIFAICILYIGHFSIFSIFNKKH